MIRIISTDTEIDYAKAYVESEAFSHLVAELDAVKEAPSKTDRILFDSEFATTRRKRGELVNQRLQTIYWRSPTYNLARVMVSLIIACILGSVFIFKRNYAMYAEVDIRARLATIFLSFIITGILAITSSLPVMTKIRDMYYRHRDAGMYDSYSMGIALGVAEKPFILCSSVLFCIVFVTSADFGDGWRGLVVFGVRICPLLFTLALLSLQIHDSQCVGSLCRGCLLLTLLSIHTWDSSLSVW